MKKARTQLDDLKDELKEVQRTIAYCNYKKAVGTPLYKFLVNKEHEIVSTINNIR